MSHYTLGMVTPSEMVKALMPGHREPCNEALYAADRILTALMDTNSALPTKEQVMKMAKFIEKCMHDTCEAATLFESLITKGNEDAKEK